MSYAYGPISKSPTFKNTKRKKKNRTIFYHKIINRQKGSVRQFLLPDKLRETVIDNVSGLTNFDHIKAHYSGRTGVDEFIENAKIKDPKETSVETTEFHLSVCFNQQASLSGSSVIPVVNKVLRIDGFEYPKIRDFDVYFNVNKQYVFAKAMTVHNPYIDVNYYVHIPWELHDISPVEASMSRYNMNDYIFLVSLNYEEAWRTGVGKINHNNIIWVNRTLERLLRYSERFGFKWLMSDVLALYQYNPDPDTMHKVLDSPYVVD